MRLSFGQGSGASFYLIRERNAPLVDHTLLDLGGDKFRIASRRCYNASSD